MKQFACQRCGTCCRQPGFVYLTEADVERLAACLLIDVYRFTEKYCLLMDRRHLALKKDSGEICLFLGAQGCLIYEARPAQCREFPLNWKTTRSLGYCEGLKKVSGIHGLSGATF